MANQERMTNKERAKYIYALETIVASLQPAIEHYADHKSWSGVPQSIYVGNGIVTDLNGFDLARGALVQAMQVGLETQLMKARQETNEDWRKAIELHLPEIKDCEFRGPSATVAWLMNQLKK